MTRKSFLSDIKGTHKKYFCHLSSYKKVIANVTFGSILQCTLTLQIQMSLATISLLTLQADSNLCNNFSLFIHNCLFMLSSCAVCRLHVCCIHFILAVRDLDSLLTQNRSLYLLYKTQIVIVRILLRFCRLFTMPKYSEDKVEVFEK